MRTFVLRARAAPTDSAKLLASVGGDAHAEILAIRERYNDEPA